MISLSAPCITLTTLGLANIGASRWIWPQRDKVSTIKSSYLVEICIREVKPRYVLQLWCYRSIANYFALINLGRRIWLKSSRLSIQLNGVSSKDRNGGGSIGIFAPDFVYPVSRNRNGWSYLLGIEESGVNYLVKYVK